MKLDGKVIRCPKCKGNLYEPCSTAEDGARKIYEEEHVRCLLCGRDFDKVLLYNHFGTKTKKE